MKDDQTQIDMSNFIQMDYDTFQKKLAKEIEYKGAMRVEGVSIEEQAMEGVGTRYKETISYLFDTQINHRVTPGTYPPADCCFPLGTQVVIRYDMRSPYRIKKEDGQLILQKNGKFLTTLEWAERPKYYGKLAPDGQEMQRIMPMHGNCLLGLNFVNRCDFFRTNEQCLFCNINPTAEWNKEQVAAKKLAKSVGKIAKAAFEEGFNWHILLISGRLQGNNATGLALQYIEAIKAELGWDYVPGNFNGTTPPDFSEMDRLHEAGLLGWGSNLEVWNPDVFRWMCPGKHRTVGRERWIEGLKHAVSVFGRGNVYSLLIMGLENKDSFLEGVKAQSEMGVVTFNANWTVVRGSKLEGHRAPHPEELAEWNSLAVDIMEKYLPEYFTPELFTSGSAPACYRCVQISTHLDEMRRRTGHTIVMPNDSGKKLVYVDRDRLLVGSPYAKVPGKAVCP